MRERRWIALCLAVLFVLGGGLLLGHLRESGRAARLSREAEAAARSGEARQSSAEGPSTPQLTAPPIPMAAEPEVPSVLLPAPAEEESVSELDEDLLFLLEMDLDALRATNEDVLGWVCIPGTAVSYPLLRSADNREYLNLAWDGSYSKAGSIFLECKNREDLSDFHTLIYGHNWGNGLMFSPLLDYGAQEFAAQYPYVYIVTDESVRRYEVFSAYTADVVSDTYRLYFEDDARRQSALDFYAEQSQVVSSVTPTVGDSILTLSTCTGLGVDGIRWVVHTVLTEQFPRG